MINDLAQAAQLQSRGDLAGARRLADAAVASRPRDLNALRIAGTLACQTGDLARGVALLTRALTAAPGDEVTRVNLVQALAQSGELTAAERIAAEAPRVTPDLLLLRALVARQTSDSGRALELLMAVVESRPKDGVAWNNLGNLHLEAGRVDEAEQAFLRAAEARPDDSAVQANLARVQAVKGDLEPALRRLREAAEASPNDAKILFALAQALAEADQWSEALPVLGSAARLDRANPALFTLMGVVFEHLGDRARAEQSYRFALQFAPAHAPALLNLGILLEQGNRLDELSELRQRLATEPAAANVGRYLEALLLRRAGEPDSAIDDRTRHALLGQLSDRLNEPSRAFAEFTAMHAGAAASGAFRGDEAWTEVQSWTTELDLRLQAGWDSVDVPPEQPAPAFLLGFMRSGTTLLDTMLMGHSQTHVLEEIPILGAIARHLGSPAKAADLDSDAVAEFRRRYFSELQKLSPPSPGKLVIDKFPMATLHAPLIYRLFPDAKIVFALRHPCDVVLSCFMQNFRLSKTMASFLTIENAARYYAAAMTFWTMARERLPLHVHTVRYEDLLEDQKGELRSLSDYLGLGWEEGLLSHERTARERGYIRTPSYHQVTEGLYRRSSGRWQRYAEQMAPALPILAPWVERFGYEPIT
jgi:Flp pilus assembly protein TadD